MSVIRTALIIFAIVVALVATSTVLGCACETEAEAFVSSAALRQQRQAEYARDRQEFRERREASEKRLAKLLAERRAPVEVVEAPPRRRVRRWQWESPSETRARVWNTPELESFETTATGLLRICLSEADGGENDCVAIFQVLQNIRSRSCNRGRIRRITECDEDGETLLSVMRRAQKYAMGVLPPRSGRTRWIAEVELDCAQPSSWRGSKQQWDSQYGRWSCKRASELVKALVKREHRDIEWTIEGVRALTWGGRCENKQGACDDPLACERGLARIPDTDTLNAFWCRPGSPGCAPTVDPICRQYREHRGLPVVAAAKQSVVASGE